jgi:hypothetical protein
MLECSAAYGCLGRRFVFAGASDAWRPKNLLTGETTQKLTEFRQPAAPRMPHMAVGVIASRNVHGHNHGSAGAARHRETAKTGGTNAARDRRRPIVFYLHR